MKDLFCALNMTSPNALSLVIFHEYPAVLQNAQSATTTDCGLHP